MIDLFFPDGMRFRLDEDDARDLADVLWESTEGGSAATVAVAIEQELERSSRERRPIDVPERNAARVAEAIAELSGRPARRH